MINNQRMTALHIACLNGDVAIVDMLIQHGADIMMKDIKQFLPLHYAIVQDNIPVLRYLYEALDLSNSIFDKKFECCGHKLMALAVQNGSYNSIKLLVEWGANCQEKDQQDYTYLHVAAVSGHVNIFLYFLARKVPIHAKTKQGKTAIELAQTYKHDHLIKYLRDKYEQASIL